MPGQQNTVWVRLTGRRRSGNQRQIFAGRSLNCHLLDAPAGGGGVSRNGAGNPNSPQAVIFLTSITDVMMRS